MSYKPNFEFKVNDQIELRNGMKGKITAIEPDALLPIKATVYITAYHTPFHYSFTAKGMMYKHGPSDLDIVSVQGVGYV